MSIAEFKQQILEYVEQEAETDTKLITENREVYNQFMLFSKKQKSNFFEAFQKLFQLSSAETQRLFEQYEREFLEEITGPLRDEILAAVHASLEHTPIPREFQIAQAVYDEIGKRNGISRPDCTSYVKYCVKQINKHEK